MKKILLTLFITIIALDLAFAQQAVIKTEGVTPHGVEELGLPTNSVSSGLSVVPNQTYVYLSANVYGTPDSLTGAAFSVVSQPSGSNVTLTDFTTPEGAMWVYFRPMVVGEYVIGLTASTASGSYDTTTTITVADYVGVGDFNGVAANTQNCMYCHKAIEPAKFGDIFNRWKVSGHANIFNQQLTTSTHYSTSCMPCHTTGYDKYVQATNGGFDDVADSLGWTFDGHASAGKWDSLVTYYPELVNKATIGCEMCHGPGSEHATKYDKNMIAISLRASNCSQCHDEPPRHDVSAMYDNSVHAEAVYSSSFARAGSANNLSFCARCHEAQGYVDFTKGILMDATTITEANHVPITCATCHDPHGNDNTASLRFAPAGSDTLANGYSYAGQGGLGGEVCMNCHKARGNGNESVQGTVSSSHWGPHHGTQADVLLGQNAADFGVPFQNGSHVYAVTNACVDCHMYPTVDVADSLNRDKVGGHSWNMNNPATDFDYTAACTQCHGQKSSFDDFIAPADYDRNGKVESVQDEVKGLLDKLAKALPPVDDAAIDYKQVTSLVQKKAYWNYQLIGNDGSYGIHNSKFAIDVLMQSIVALGGTVGVDNNQIQQPKNYALEQNYPNPFNPSTTIKYNVAKQSNIKVVVYNITGEVVSVLVNGVQSAGTHQAIFNTNSANLQLSSGIYFYTIQANAVDGSQSFKQTKKMVLLK